jgi:cytoskeletal protein CcmA (bactofilin family)
MTVITNSNNIKGTIRGSGDVRIEGQVNGKIDITGQLVIAEGGAAEAKIAARAVTVAGGVVGDILAADRIELAPTAVVEGNMTAPRILITDGATFRGQVLMQDPGAKEPPKVPEPVITTSSARRPQDQKNDDK